MKKLVLMISVILMAFTSTFAQDSRRTDQDQQTTRQRTTYRSSRHRHHRVRRHKVVTVRDRRTDEHN